MRCPERLGVELHAVGRVLAMADHSEKDPGTGPLELRATFPAASIFKMVTAASVLEEGKLRRNTPVRYSGDMYRLTRRQLRRDRGRGSLTLSQAFASAGAPDNSHFQTMGELLLAGQDLAQSLVVDVFTFSLGALMYHWIFYQTKLVPRWLSIWGLVAVALVLISGLVNMFGGPSLSTLSDILNLPNFVNELVLAVWLIVKGFNQEQAQEGATRVC